MVFILFCLGIFTTANAGAVTDLRLQEGGLAVSPFLLELEGKAGDTTFGEIEVFNTSDIQQNLKYSIQDFEPQGQSGQVRFLPVGADSSKEYSLSSWIKVRTQPDFTLAPKSQTNVKFQVDVPLDAGSGTKYAGIVFSFENESVSDANLKVERKLGVLVLLRTGSSKPLGSFTSDKKMVFTNLPLQLTSTFVNSGNVHVAPKGEYSVYNWLGRLVTTLPINRDANLVLPETARVFTSTSTKWLFGRYTVEGIVYFGSEPKMEARVTRTIWVFPITSLANYFVASLGALVLLYLGLKLYNRWIVNKLNR